MTIASNAVRTIAQITIGPTTAQPEMPNKVLRFTLTWDSGLLDYDSISIHLSLIDIALERHILRMSDGVKHRLGG